MARQKQVFDKDMVAHLWANRSQDSARSKCDNFWFTGAKLYSYGSHYVAGFITDWKTPDGSTVVILNAEKYSNTTAKHCYLARQALSSLFARFHLDGMRDSDLTSYGAWRFIAESAIAQSKAKLNEAAKYNAEHKIVSAVNEAKALSDLARIACDNAPREYKAEAKKLRKTIPDYSEHIATRAGMAVLRTELEIARQKDLLTQHTARAINGFCGAYGYADSRGIKIASSNYEPSKSIYVPDAQSALRSVQGAIDAHCLAHTAVKKIGLKRLPPMPSLSAMKGLYALLTPLAAREHIESRVVHVRRAIRQYHAAYRFQGQKQSALGGVKVNNTDWGLGDLAKYATTDELAVLDYWHTIIGKASRYQEISAYLNQCQAVASNISVGNSFLPRYEQDAMHHFKHAIKAAERASNALDRMPSRAMQHFAAQLPSVAELRVQVEEWNAKEVERNAEKLAAWRAGVGYVGGGRYLCPHVVLRIKGDKIETSHGAEMPVAHARAVYLAVRMAIRSGSDWECPPNAPIKMGHFTLNKARVDGSVVAGCHDIPGEEIAAIAVQLGLCEEKAVLA